MKHLLVSGAVIVLCAGCAGVGGAATTSQSLMAREDWQSAGISSWTFSDNLIESIGNGSDTMLVSLRRWDRLELTASFRPDAQVNAGVFLHCDNPAEITPLTCFEINIWDDHPDQTSRTGAIVTHQSPLASVDTAGQWNDLHITSTPERLTVVINGVTTADLANPGRVGGHIALQRWNGGAVAYRDITITPLPAH